MMYDLLVITNCHLDPETVGQSWHRKTKISVAEALAKEG